MSEAVLNSRQRQGTHRRISHDTCNIWPMRCRLVFHRLWVCTKSENIWSRKALLSVLAESNWRKTGKVHKLTDNREKPAIFGDRTSSGVYVTLGSVWLWKRSTPQTTIRLPFWASALWIKLIKLENESRKEAICLFKCTFSICQAFMISPVILRHLKGAKRFSQYGWISCDLDGILKKVRRITGVLHGSDAVNGGWIQWSKRNPLQAYFS